jgi:hypothetical protein
VACPAAQLLRIEVIAEVPISAEEWVVFQQCPSVRYGVGSGASDSTKTSHRITAFLEEKRYVI